jgi:hypothetical protein
MAFSPEVLPIDEVIEVSALEVTRASNATESIQDTKLKTA